MFATFTSLLPSALQLHASPEKTNGGITSDFKPDNEDDDDENIPSAGQAPVNEFGQVKDQKAKEKKAANETFIFVRPPPSKTNHPLNLQVQLVPPNTRGPTGLTPTSTTSVNSSAYGDANTPVTATPARTSFGQGPRRQGTDESTNDLSRTSTNQSDASTAMYSSGYSSVASFSSVASTASSSSSRRTIIPLYNLQAHNVMTNTIVDAGTDAKIAKFQKRGLEMVGLALLEPVEVWPSTSTVAQQAPSTPVNSAAFAQPRSNRTSLDSRRPPHNGSGFLHAHPDKTSRPVTPTLSDDAHGHTPTSSRLSVSSAGIDSTLHHAQSQDGLHAQQQQSNHPYPSQFVSPIPEGSAVDGSSKKNIFGKLFKRKGANTNATPDLSTYSPLPSPTPMGGTSKSRPVTPKAPASPMYSPSPTSPEMATTPTLTSSANQFVSANQHLTVASQSHHRVPSAPVISTTAPHDRSNSETENGETPTPRNKRQAASFNLPGFMNKGSALIGRNAGGRNKPPSPIPPPLPPREHAPVSESPTIMATPPMARNGDGKPWPNRSGEPSKRDSGVFGPVTPTDSSGSVNVHNPPTPTPASQPVAPVQALRPPVLGIQPSLSIVPAGSKAAKGKANRATMYVWIVRRWFKGSDSGLLGNLGKIGSGVIGLGIGDEKRVSTLNKGSDAWSMFEVRFEWKRGKSGKGGKKKQRDGDRSGRRASLVIGNPPPRRDRSRNVDNNDGRAGRSESKTNLRSSADGPGDGGVDVDRSPRDKATKRLSLLSQNTTSTKTSDEEKRPKSRSHSRPRQDGGEEEDDGEDSDPEDSETPWTCTLKVKRLTTPPTGSGLLVPLTQTASRSPRSSAYSRNSLDLTNVNVNPALLSDPSAPQTLKLKLGTLSPTPHHPKVVAMLKVPFPLADVEVERMVVRKRTLPSHRPATSAGPGDASASGSANHPPGSGLELSAEELKDVLCSTGMWLAVREGFGGVGKERRPGDGWRIRA